MEQNERLLAVAKIIGKPVSEILEVVSIEDAINQAKNTSELTVLNDENLSRANAKLLLDKYREFVKADIEPMTEIDKVLHYRSLLASNLSCQIEDVFKKKLICLCEEKYSKATTENEFWNIAIDAPFGSAVKRKCYDSYLSFQNDLEKLHKLYYSHELYSGNVLFTKLILERWTKVCEDNLKSANLLWEAAHVYYWCPDKSEVKKAASAKCEQILNAELEKTITCAQMKKLFDATPKTPNIVNLVVKWIKASETELEKITTSKEALILCNNTFDQNDMCCYSSNTSHAICTCGANFFNIRHIVIQKWQSLFNDELRKVETVEQAKEIYQYANSIMSNWTDDAEEAALTKWQKLFSDKLKLANSLEEAQYLVDYLPPSKNDKLEKELTQKLYKLVA